MSDANSEADQFPIGVWKQTNRLVLHRDAPLPPICLITNVPTPIRVRKTFFYVPGMIALTILLSPFIWLLVRWLVGEKFSLSLPLAEAYLARERRLRIIRAIFISLAILMIVAGSCQLIDPRLPAGGIEMIAGGFLLATGTFVWSLFASTRLRVTRYEEPYIWLIGVHEEVLEELPDWPWE